MTVEEKRSYIDDCCQNTFERLNGCDGCMFNYNEAWCHVGDEDDLDDTDCNEIIKKFNESIIKMIEPQEDLVNHPSHYTNGGMECIDEMILIFGIEYTMHFCLLNAWKYRRRALDKNGQQDMDKSHWYINKYKELKEKLDELHREQAIDFR